MNLDSTTRYEIKAEAFRIMSGHMAPGKDVSPHAYTAPLEERSLRWYAWQQEYSIIINAMMLAVARILPDNDD